MSPKHLFKNRGAVSGQKEVIVLPSGDLRWTPPGYTSGDPTSSLAFPGYTVLNLSGGPQAPALNDNTDYYINLGTISATSAAGGADTNLLMLNGGRNIVIVGGEILFNSINNTDDAKALQIDNGNPAGIVHLEGLHLRANNGITLRTPRITQIQNCRVAASAWNNDHSQSHPDFLQVWRNNVQNLRAGGIRMHRVSGFSSMTFLSDFTDLNAPYNGDQQPPYWEMHEVNLGPTTPGYRSGAGNHWLGHPNVTMFGSNIWFDTTLDGAGNKRGLGDSCRQFGSQYSAWVPKDPGGQICSAQYQLFSEGNVPLYTSPFPGYANPGGTAGRTQGHYLKYVDRSEHPNLDGIRWIFGLPPGGDYVPASLVGPDYGSPRYS